ncbi:MAG: hypothetical protein JWR21_1107 [Herminiimonas sp.]|nr:hypothetical protein [Herminiimonas sp.]
MRRAYSLRLACMGYYAPPFMLKRHIVDLVGSNPSYDDLMLTDNFLADKEGKVIYATLGNKPQVIHSPARPRS